jgi:hypothetical protein
MRPIQNRGASLGPPVDSLDMAGRVATQGPKKSASTMLPCSGRCRGLGKGGEQKRCTGREI